MAIALTLRGFNDLGRSVTPIWSNCRIPCHSEAMPQKRRLRSYGAKWPRSYAATELSGYVATELSGYAATQLHSYGAKWLRGYAATELSG